MSKYCDNFAFQNLLIPAGRKPYIEEQKKGKKLLEIRKRCGLPTASEQTQGGHSNELERHKRFLAYEVDLKISQSIRTEIQAESILQRKASSNRADSAAASKWKGEKIQEAEVGPDPIHMLVEIPAKISVSSFMGT